MKWIVIALGVLFMCKASNAQALQNDFILSAPGHSTNIFVDNDEKEVVKIAAGALSDDVADITGQHPEIVTDIDKAKGDIVIIGTADDPLIQNLCKENKLPAIKGLWEHFIIRMLISKKNPSAKILLIAGSDPRGTAYGVFTLSQMIGVSPWKWWADVAPDKKKILTIDRAIQIEQGSSVKYRGIFLNDEDWGLRPWASKTFEPEVGNIGPKTYARIFELLLRLKANTIWPAMHPGTTAFFKVAGNDETAKKYDIVIGTSHAEPMLCNNVGEWNKAMGNFNYVTNRKRIYNYWEQRVKQAADGDNIYTIGIRGIHDSKMEGASSTQDEKNILSKVFSDQRGLLKKYVNPDVTKVPQVFVPYKEVLPVYNAGLQVPDDVTLMWCDDNYGYINRLSDPQERLRKGSSGVYYHLSYWGAPHDYLWLSTTPPGLIWEEMTKAYRYGADRIWVANVGDIKPAEYNIQLFLDMAWNIDSIKNVFNHMKHWIADQFDESVAGKLLPVMQEYYRLAEIRKPEFMGNSRVYDNTRASVSDLPWSEQEINKRIADYKSISGKVEALSGQIPSDKQDAYFELIKYPVQAATQMNLKFLTGQLAEHGKADWKQSDAAFDSIVSLTAHYNELSNGKWKGIMDYQPRNLPVFYRVTHKQANWTLPMKPVPLYSFSGNDLKNFTSYKNKIPYVINCLGYNGKAIDLPQNTGISFSFGKVPSDSVEVDVRLIPAHAANGGQLRFFVSLDNSQPDSCNYETKENSEEWKENVLRNQAIRKLFFSISKALSHQLTLKALDEGVVIDQIIINSISK